MEFIPLKTSSEKCEKKKTKAKLKNSEILKEKPQKKAKKKPQTKIIETKEVKNKPKERLKKKRVLAKVVKKTKKEREEEEEDQIKNENEEEDEGAERNEDEEIAFKQKCEKMDKLKKNRLFIKLKKKISSEAQIKELHPDIRSVIFPRKKNTRWCWAVFASEEKAKRALKKLRNNEDILANKPTPYENVVKKRLEKKKTVLRKKEARRKLQKMWM